MSDRNTSNDVDRTNEPLEGEFQPVEQFPPTIATDGEPEDELGPELDANGSDMESNVTGRSKPASDGIAEEERDERLSNG
jgi:hypothetical protein